jgi:2-polyprenyl-3-methyl-5-hydroxy-6-metoxy-1,4-benzoquinol methylase
MVNFAKRNTRNELLDEVDHKILTTDLYQNLKELEFINANLGGHKINVSAIKKLLPSNNTEKYIVAEIGCGGGDNLKHLATYCSKNNLEVNFIGIDLKADCISYAQKYNALPNIKYFQNSYENHSFETKPDVIFSSLFCHHFTKQQLEFQLQWMQHNSSTAFFINDLQRHPIAFFAIKFLTILFSKSYLVKHDAPLSVLRAYSKNEWQQIGDSLTSITIKIYWKWAFRFLIIGNHARD